jgi:beta-lactamase regulating signal transducer with metallopeptidase domain
MMPSVLLYAFQGHAFRGLDGWMPNLIPNLGQACWQGGLVVLVVWAVCRALPRMPVRCQSWFWRLATVKFLLVLLVPTLIRLPWLPPPPKPAVMTTPTAPASVIQTHSTSTAIPLPMPSIPTPRWELPRLQSVLCFAWLLGAGWMFVRLLLAWRQALLLKSRCRIIAEGPLVEQLQLQRSLFGLRTNLKFFEAPGGGSPLLLGVFRPAIVIPRKTLARLSSAEQAMVLGHELAHIRRGDLFWGLLASLVRAVFFFHPLVWLCERQLKLAQEAAADELAIARQHHDPIGYGSLLVSVVGKLGFKREARPLVSTVSLETAGPVHSLTWRLVAMTRIGQTSRRVLVISGLLLATLVGVGLVPWRLVAAESKDPKPSASEDSSWYAAKIQFTTKAKDQPEKVTSAPTLIYKAGESVFSTINQDDKTTAMLVAVASPPKGQPEKHVIQLRWLQDPSGKELTQEDRERLLKEGVKHLPKVKPNAPSFSLKRDSCHAVNHHTNDDSPKSNLHKEYFVALRCDQDAAIASADPEDHEGHESSICVISENLFVPSGAKGKIRIGQLGDGGCPIDIEVTVTPTEAPSQAATCLAQQSFLSTSSYTATTPKEDGDKPSASEVSLWYAARIQITKQKEGEPDEVIAAPTLVYKAGHFGCVASTACENDKTRLLIVTAASPEGQSVEHTMQVHVVSDPSGKELTQEDIDRLTKAVNNDVTKVEPYEKTADLSGGSTFVLTGSMASQQLLKGQASIQIDGKGKFAIAQSVNNANISAWKSPRLMFASDSTGRVIIGKDDDTRLKIDMKVSPTEGPKEASENLDKGELTAIETVKMYGGEVGFDDGSRSPHRSDANHSDAHVTTVDIDEEEPVIGSPALTIQDCLSQLKNFPKLQRLSLFNNDIEDSMLKHLEPLDQLQALAIRSDKMKGDGLKYLKELPQLRELYIIDIEMTEVGLSHLKALPQLQTLSLDRTKVAKDALSKLQQALPKCKITVIRNENTEIESQGKEGE